MKEILISDNPVANQHAQDFYPCKIISRAELAGIDPLAVKKATLDGNDTEILEQFMNAERFYIAESIDFSADFDTLGMVYRNATPYTPVGDTMGVSLPSNEAPTLDVFVEEATYEIPMLEQIAILDPLLANRRIGAGTIAELTAQLVDICRSHDLFSRDIITGLFRSRFTRKPLTSEEHAKTMFFTHFIDKLYIKTHDYKIDKATGQAKADVSYKRISKDELKLLWQNVSLYSTFNSRKEFYESIPEWDGEERIMTFMKKYFECDTNPNFFLLLMTSLVAKFAPKNDYCPYFFDFVANSKGIGKSLLCRRLLGGKYCSFLTFAVGRRDDFYVNAYDSNSAIVVDDECTWVSSKGNKGFSTITPDEFKNIVTTPTDVFSRKHMNPEEHARSFIIIRTSNDVNQVYATNERRQIIFQCNLAEQECRILDLPDEFFTQMLAEAKDYYVKHGGRYQLTDDDKLDIKESNLNNYNTETKENFAIMSYVKAARTNPDLWCVKLNAKKFGSEKWGNYQKYVEWCEENKKPTLQHRPFWRSVSALAEYPENCISVLSDKKYDLADGGKCRVFRIDPVTTDQPADEIPDIPY